LNLTGHLLTRERLDDPILKKIWTDKELRDELRQAAVRKTRALIELSVASREYEAAKARLEINERLNHDE
jgi:hypothetical protein